MLRSRISLLLQRACDNLMNVCVLLTARADQNDGILIGCETDKRKNEGTSHVAAQFHEGLRFTRP